MFSTLTERGASATIDALSAGASDYVTKPGKRRKCRNGDRTNQGGADPEDQNTRGKRQRMSRVPPPSRRWRVNRSSVIDQLVQTGQPVTGNRAD